ncbi:hypothetical protein PR202_gb03325 [Eleusine coracana subsp. coracana]|uniref:Uncharacterized protein n=1 Tax=Eleusine coracana subsp. coracana TaxID=191504 RepID=A0AAV5E1K1_ELECO|nr:hypothetical protein PR202_gb03325 [Eleusine coracana subsp. coracana]
MAPWPARPVMVLVLLLALLCSHIALCSSAADSGKPSKPKASGGRKALLAAASVDDDGDETPVVKPPAKKKAAAVAAAGKIKKKVGYAAEGKNQTAKAATKAKKSESAAAAKGTTAKKTTSNKASGADSAAVVKTKVPKTDKAATKAKGAADSAKPAKVSKPGAAKAAKPAKAAKSDSAAAGATKPKKPTNSTVGVEGKAKSAKKKAAQPVVVVADDKPTAKATKDEETTTESVVVDTDVAAFAAEAGAEDSDDLISEFRDLPSRLQETLMPDLARLSHSSKAYLSAANAGIADGVRPLLGGRWAAALATAASVALLLLPLCALTAAVRRAGAYLPLLHRALLLAQAYLAIYFATLALAAAATGLEPLRFFHAASPAAYAWTQAAQSLGFVAYLVLQMVDLVAVFSGASPVEDGGSGNGDAAKALGLAQMVVGLAVGLHYYAAVFHRAAAGEAPRANWRVYAVYAACFVVICACARAERRKKAYLADGAAEEWKKS